MSDQSNQKARVNAILGQIQGLYDELRQIAVETGETVYVNSPSGERSEYVYISDEPTATEWGKDIDNGDWVSSSDFC